MLELLKALPAVASSKLALIAYIAAVLAWLLVALKSRRNKNLLAHLEKLRPEDRLFALEQEMGTVRVPRGLSANQWLKARRQRYYFAAFAIACSIPVFLIASAVVVSWDSPRGELRVLDAPISGATSATEEAFRADLKKRSRQRNTEALDYFRAAERDFGESRFAQAANNYEQSVRATPTIPAYLNLGVSYECVSRFDLAIQSLSLGLRLAEQDMSRDYEAAFHNNLAHVYEAQGFHEEAVDHGQKALDLTKRDSTRNANALITLARLDDDHGDFDQALDKANRALVTYTGANDKVGLAVAHNTLGNAFLGKGNLAKSLSEYQAALAIYQGTNDVLGQVRAGNNIGNAYAGQGQYKEALRSYEEALRHSRVVGSREEEARILSNIGDVEREQHTDLGSAERHATEALAIYSEIGSPQGRATASLNLGNIHTTQGKYAEARQNFNEARLLYQQAGNTAGEANAVGNIAEALRGQKLYDESLRYANEALSIFTRVGDLQGQANTYLDLGNTYILQEKPSRALESYAHAKAIATQSGNRMQEALALAGKGGAELDLLNLAASLADSEQAQAMFKSLGDAIGEAAALANIGLVHEKQGKPTQALKELTSARSTYLSKGVLDSQIATINDAIRRLQP